MKGVDLSNQFISYYELNFRTVRWWKRIFNEHIDVAIINSLCLFKKSVNLHITQKTFRLNLVKAIMLKNHPFKFVNNVKLDNLHLIKADNSGSDIIANIAQKQNHILLINVQHLNIIVLNAKFFYVLIAFITIMKKNLIVRKINSILANLIIQNI